MFSNPQCLQNVKQDTPYQEPFLLIKFNKIKARNQSSDIVFEVRELSAIGLDGKAHDYYATLSFFTKYKRSIRIAIQTPTKIKYICLRHDILERISNYLKNPKKDFDCNGFAHFINGVKYEFGKFHTKDWNCKEEHSPLKLRPGDTVLITKNKDKILPAGEGTHLAIYLGDNLFLSKFGKSGNLIVTTLEEMKKGFGGDYLFKITPKILR